MADLRITRVDISRVTGESRTDGADDVAVEEPLEIRVAWSSNGGLREKTIAVTMRTPGDDEDLAAGFLFTERILRSGTDIESVRQWGSPNVVRVAFREGVTLDASRLDRHFYTTSSCGVCGKTSIEAIRVDTPRIEDGITVDSSVIHRLPNLLAEQQAAYHATGGLHAAALFDRDGTLLRVREDIGRHNAVDKLIGSFVRDSDSMAERILFVSSRASFELVQKAAVAGIPMLAAVGAPSSLAIELAREMNVTLLGFVREERFNVYEGENVNT